VFMQPQMESTLPSLIRCSAHLSIARTSRDALCPISISPAAETLLPACINRLSDSVDNGMPLVDDEPSKETSFGRLYSFLRHSLNFYRLHILYLCVIPHLPEEALDTDHFLR